ncbi:thiamine-phosphate pyrophosphorylase [Halobacteroides halobius DSM 5150]|uniref:Thiamine-phosphate synthase n=1 Tax=Halobacteroides halobius (strain ATCC 35273 / DSM 5150 / MD-1) TaxID=748449 RepID=L0K9P1_HALHC|nr:thiamine phosphate synthase [Halobacteroides halobius]AGB41255.1 thiamine-phosphate pyrophosphorylase [Halobacteroides halobius DSM 5150]
MKERDLLNGDLYCITGEKYSLGRDNIRVVKEMIAGGIKVIQYREKNKKMLYKYQECKKIKELTDQAGITFIINDDIALALALDADGVHIGQEDLPIKEVRKIVGEDKIIGLSTHSPAQANNAVKKGADYIGVGPIFKTNTKEDVCQPVGLGYLEYVAENIDLPFVAIGGIKEDNITLVKEKGANCIAMITEIVGAKDITNKIKRIREKI